MTRDEKFNIRKDLELRAVLDSMGKAVLRNKADTVPKLALTGFYLLGALYVWSRSRGLSAAADSIELLSPIMEYAMRHSVRAYLTVGGILLLVLAFYPLGRKWTEESLKSIGLINKAGMAPTLIRKKTDVENSNVTVWTFRNNSIPLKTWEDKRAEIETALGVTIARMTYGKGNQRVILYTILAESALPDLLPWQDNYLSSKSFVLMLGQSYTGPVSVNLADIPHILIGGSTGSGKTVLLKVLIHQALEKGAEVAIADFKGGVDFPTAWRERCRLCCDEEALLGLLDSYVAELKARKELLQKAGQPHIDAYNKADDKDLPRLIFACDEIAEVLDKTGLTKEQKERIGQIESRLSMIARQGRAFGIHLILATQRPDANILSGQIRNNINCRVCGRADNVLSQIILDNTNAADQIPKDAKGRFLLHDGTVFQGYWLDEGSV